MRINFFLCCSVLLFSSLPLASAHVRLLFTGTPIRNAPGPRVDGAYSVSGPCGGMSQFGRNGITTVTESTTMSLKLAYNGGHQNPANAIHAAIKCGGMTNGANFDDSVLRSQATLTATPPVLTLTDGTLSVGAADSSTAGYTLTFKLPALPNGVTTQNCVLSLLDQQSWGGCVDLNMVSAGAGTGTGPDTTVTSMCTKYCAGMSQYCGTGPLYQFTGTDCMTACAKYPVSTESPYLSSGGDYLQCRMNHLDFVRTTNLTYHCAHAGIASEGNCVQNGADGPAPASPCTNYCNAIASKCASSNFFSSTNDCFKKCASFLSTGAGIDATPPQGPHIQCRTAAALAGKCTAASPTPTGDCAVANPLKIQADTLSATYYTQAGMCDSAAAAASNTFGGCCCYSGWLQVVHVKGASYASLTVGLNQLRGELCQSGTVQVGNATYNVPTVLPMNYTITRDFWLMQKDPSVTDLSGTFTIGNDPFTVELVDGLLLVTNNVPSTSQPRVCSVSAKATAQSKIDTSAYPPPADPDNPNAGLNAASSLHVSFLLLGFVALLSMLLVRV